MFKKIMFFLTLAVIFFPLSARALEPKSTSETIDDMQKQVAELQEKISALREIKKNKEPDIREVENRKRYSKMIAAQVQPEEVVVREYPVSSSRGRKRMFQFYGGTTMWAHQRTNNETQTTTTTTNITTNDGLDAGYSLDLFLEANLGDNHKLIVYGEAGDGTGVNSSLGTLDPLTGQYGGLYANPNYDAYTNRFGTNRNTTFNISALYYEGLFYDEKLLVSIGKMDIHSMYDQNEFAGDETTQFMNNLFVRSTGVTFKKLDNYYAPGARLMVTPISTFEVSLILANSNFNDADNNGLAVVQVNFKPSNLLFGGNYRFFWVFDDRVYTPISGIATTDNNVGWGISFDQRFTDWLGAFFRYSSMESDIQENSVDGSWSLGAEISGLLWNRPEDALGLAYGVALVNNRVIGLPHYKDEKQFEAYYRYSINEYIALSPNIQIITDQPRANPSTVAIFGMRSQIDFRL